LLETSTCYVITVKRGHGWLETYLCELWVVGDLHVYSNKHTLCSLEQTMYVYTDMLCTLF